MSFLHAVDHDFDDDAGVGPRVAHLIGATLLASTVSKDHVNVRIDLVPAVSAIQDAARVTPAEVAAIAARWDSNNVRRAAIARMTDVAALERRA